MYARGGREKRLLTVNPVNPLNFQLQTFNYKLSPINFQLKLNFFAGKLGGIEFNPYFCVQLINNKESRF